MSRLRSAGKPAGPPGPRLVLAVEGMHCGSCGLVVNTVGRLSQALLNSPEQPT